MDLIVKGKQLDVGDALREHVRMKLVDSTKKYFNHQIDATVTFSKVKQNFFKADISVHLGSGIMLHSQHEAGDPYPAFDVANDRLAKRLRKYKDRLKDHHKRVSELPEDVELPAKYYTLEHTPADETDTEASDEPAIIAEIATMIPTLTVSEAVMRLEFADAPVMLFKNAGHGGMNLVYWRNDGNIGWIDPQGNPPKVKKDLPEKPAKKGQKTPAAKPSKATKGKKTK